jgi:hypothetical protein
VLSATSDAVVVANFLRLVANSCSVHVPAKTTGGALRTIRSSAPPDPSGPYYAGNPVLFALGHAHGREGVTGGQVALDVTATLARQRELGLWSGGPVKIDLHPAEVEPTEAQGGPLASIGQVQLLGR